MIKKVLFFVIGCALTLTSCTDSDFENDETPAPLPALSCAGFVADGYCNKLSYLPGETVHAFLNSNNTTPACALTVYSLAGDSVFSIASPMLIQKINTNDPASNGFGYVQTVQFKIPLNTSSGVYMIQHAVPFIVKPSQPVDVLVVYPSNTANAYSLSGGKSFYSNDRATTLSFLRPIDLEPFSKQGLLWFDDLAGIRVGYITDRDLETQILQARIICIVGHSEYWSRQARVNFDRFVNDGNHALILSGNTMWWQIRYETNFDQLICYKNWDTDPTADPLLKTVNWTEPELQYQTIQSVGQDFSRGGYGQKPDTGWDGFKVIKPSSPLFEGTNLAKGDIISCPTSEYDGAPISTFNLDGYPELDLNAIGAARGEIIAYDRGFRKVDTYGTFIVYQRTPTSGIIINVGSTDWCSTNGMGGNSGAVIKQITSNAINKLLENAPVFSE